MAETAAQQNESMEDILHSIRRIIASDPADATGNEVGVPMDDEPLELTEVVEGGADNTVDPMDAITDAMVSTGVMEAEEMKVESVAEEVAPPPPPPPAPKPQPVIEPVSAVYETQNDSLINHNTAEASAHALKNLVNSIPKPKVESMLMRSGSTLEDLVVESLKPELSEWLNKNLPTLVQSLVEKEIRKLIPRD